MPAAAPFLIHVSPGHVARVLRSDSSSFAGLHTSEVKQSRGIIAVVARRDGLSMLHFDQRMNPQLLIREMACDPESRHDSFVYLHCILGASPLSTMSRFADPVSSQIARRLLAALESHLGSKREMLQRVKAFEPGDDELRRINHSSNNEATATSDEPHLFAVLDSLQVDAPLRANRSCFSSHQPRHALHMFVTPHDGSPFDAERIAYHPQHARLQLTRACEQLWGARQRLVDAANATPFHESALKPLYKAQPALLFDGQHWLKPNARDLTPQSNEAHGEQRTCRFTFAMGGRLGLISACAKMLEKLEHTIESCPFGDIHVRVNSGQFASDIATWLMYFHNDSSKSAAEQSSSQFTLQAVMNSIWIELQRPMRLMLSPEERLAFERAHAMQLPYEMWLKLNSTSFDAKFAEWLLSSSSELPSFESPTASACAGSAICHCIVSEAATRVKLVREHETTLQRHTKAKEAINTLLSIKDKATQKQKSDAITLVRASCLADDALLKLCDRLLSKSKPASTSAASSSATAQRSASNAASTSSAPAA